MSEPRVVTILKRPWKRPIPTGALSFEGVEAVEIVAPDRYLATLLLRYATPYFAAELVAGSPSIVRFHPPPVGRDWVVELLTLVERWLESAPLPCAEL